jgi:hypothetical protein
MVLLQDRRVMRRAKLFYCLADQCAVLAQALQDGLKACQRGLSLKGVVAAPLSSSNLALCFVIALSALAMC